MRQKELNINQRNKMTDKTDKQIDKINENVKDKVGKMQAKTQNAPVKEKSSDNKSNQSNESESKAKTSEQTKSEAKVGEKRSESKPEKKQSPIPKVKKTEAIVNANSIPISTKTSAAICKFIKNKKIPDAIADLEQVLAKKKAVPMKGEIPHRKGKGISSGRYPKKASEHFIKLLKSLSANAVANGLDEPIIKESIANKASRPYARFGRWQRKRTHVKIIAREKKEIKKKNKKKGGKK